MESSIESHWANSHAGIAQERGAAHGTTFLAVNDAGRLPALSQRCTPERGARPSKSVASESGLRRWFLEHGEQGLAEGGWRHGFQPGHEGHDHRVK